MLACALAARRAYLIRTSQGLASGGMWASEFLAHFFHRSLRGP